MSRLLYVVHALPAWEPSGTPLIAWSYIEHALKGGHEVAVVVPGARVGQIPGITLISLPPAQDQPWALSAYVRTPENIPGAEQILQFKPDVVHIIDWVLFPTGILKTLGELRVPIVRHIWNFEDMCAFISPILFMPDFQPCQKLDANQCGECIVRRAGIRTTIEGPIDQIIDQLTRARAANAQNFATTMKAKWGLFEQHLSSLYSIVVFPCNSFRKYAEDLFSFGSARRITIEHGINVSAVVPQAALPTPPRFVFVGPCEPRKGWPVVEAAFLRLLSERPGSLLLRVYGPPHQSPLSSRPGVSFLPAFAHQQLSEVLAWGQVGLIPSYFETFSRIVREYLAHGLAVVGSDAFGIPDAVTHDRNGLIIGQPTVDGLYAALVRLLDEPGLLARLQAGARETKIRTEAEEFAELNSLYQSLIPR